MPTPEALMEAYQHGDAAAVALLVDCVSPALHRFLALHSGDRRHADDLLQEAWLRIHRARHTYRPGEPLMPWLYGIARHVKVDMYRKRRFERHEEPLESAGEPAAPLERGREVPDLDTLLGVLPEGQREVVSLLKISGLTLEEVARATCSSVGSVKQKAHRAYEKLRIALAEFRPAARNEPAP